MTIQEWYTYKVVSRMSRLAVIIHIALALVQTGAYIPGFSPFTGLSKLLNNQTSATSYTAAFVFCSVLLILSERLGMHLSVLTRIVVSALIAGVIYTGYEILQFSSHDYIDNFGADILVGWIGIITFVVIAIKAFKKYKL